MVKGIQRRMVEVRLRGSRIYEWAYFVMRADRAREPISEREILDEANKIIASLEAGREKCTKNSSSGKILSGALLLLLGLVIGFAIGVLI